jgi:hypothetical protein
VVPDVVVAIHEPANEQEAGIPSYQGLGLRHQGFEPFLLLEQSRRTPSPSFVICFILPKIQIFADPQQKRPQDCLNLVQCRNACLHVLQRKRKQTVVLFRVFDATTLFSYIVLNLYFNGLQLCMAGALVQDDTDLLSNIEGRTTET